ARRCRRGRRDADLLPRLDPVAGRRALAREAQLSRPRPARDQVEADVRQVPLEPPVEPDSVVVFADGEGAHIGHRLRLAINAPPCERSSWGGGPSNADSMVEASAPNPSTTAFGSGPPPHR